MCKYMEYWGEKNLKHADYKNAKGQVNYSNSLLMVQINVMLHLLHSASPGHDFRKETFLLRFSNDGVFDPSL